MFIKAYRKKMFIYIKQSRDVKLINICDVN